MKFEINYKVTWTHHAPKSKYCYTETKWFETELERNKFLLDLFDRRDKGEFVLVEVEANEIKSWKNY
jgi:hypothetical protein